MTWYTCGPTVYDVAHMGHARAYLTFDILRLGLAIKSCGPIEDDTFIALVLGVPCALYLFVR